MNPHRQTTRTLLGRALGLFKNPPREVAEPARDRIARVLELTAQRTMEAGEHPDWLIETPVKPVPHGIWTRPMVRTAAVLGSSVLLFVAVWSAWRSQESRVASEPKAPEIQKEVSASDAAPPAPLVPEESRGPAEPSSASPTQPARGPAPAIVSRDRAKESSPDTSTAAREPAPAIVSRSASESSISNQGATASAIRASAGAPRPPQPASSMAELCAAHALVAEARVESLIPFVGPSFTATDVVWRLTSVLKGTETSTAIVVALIDVNLQRVAPVPGQRYLLFANSFSSNLPERPGAARYFLGASLAVDEGRIGPVNGFSAGQLTPALQTRISAMTPEQVRAEVAANSRMRQIRLQAGVQSGAPLLNSVWGAPLSLLNDLSGARLVFTADSAPLPGPQRRAASPLYGLLFTSPEEFVLEEGTYRVSLEGVPFGYEARAAMFDRGVGLTRPVDLQRDFLKVDSQRNPIDLFVSLVPDPAAQGVTVRGRLSGLPAGATPSPMWVSLLSDGAVPNRAGIVAAGADGRFEFSKVPPGRYFARVSQSALTARDRWAASTGTVVVGNSDTSVELPLAVRGIRVDIKVSVTGRDGRSVSFLPDNFFVTFARASLLVERTSGEGGLSATLAPGDYTVAPGVLPAGFTLKSIRSGATDLTVRPLSVGNAPVLPLGNAGLPPAPPIEVVLQYEF